MKAVRWQLLIVDELSGTVESQLDGEISNPPGGVDEAWHRLRQTIKAQATQIASVSDGSADEREGRVTSILPRISGVSSGPRYTRRKEIEASTQRISEIGEGASTGDRDPLVRVFNEQARQAKVLCELNKKIEAMHKALIEIDPMGAERA